MLASAFSLFAQTDRDRLGIKGVALSVEDWYSFTLTGGLESMTVYLTNGNAIPLELTQVTADRITGTYPDGSVTLTFRNSRPEQIVITEPQGTLTQTLHYGENGLPESIDEIHSYEVYEAGGKYARKVRRETEHHLTYYNYSFDVYGNWTFRAAAREDGVSYEQKRSILYDSAFVEQFGWDLAVRSGDLNAIASYARDTRVSAAYRARATQYWNEQKMKEAAGRSQDVAFLCRLSKEKLLTEENRRTVLEQARKHVYDTEILPLNDYKKIDGYVSYSKEGVSLFDSAWQQKIRSRGTEVRNRMLADYKDKMNRAYGEGRPQEAASWADRILSENSRDADALAMREEVDYQNLAQRVSSGSVSESDYERFLTRYPSSERRRDLENARALLATSHLDKNSSYSELFRVAHLPMDAATAQTVTRKVNQLRHRLDRQSNRAQNGSVLHMALSAESGIGTSLNYSGGLLLRIGRYSNRVNLVTGVQANFRTLSLAGDLDTSSPTFHSGTLSVPVMLRLNRYRGETSAFYLGAGVDLTVLPLYAYYNVEYPYYVKDRRLVRPFNVSPKLSVGWAFGKVVEFETYAMMDVRSHYDSEYVSDYVYSDGTPLYTTCEEGVYEATIYPLWYQRIQLGIALRFNFF